MNYGLEAFRGFGDNPHFEKHAFVKLRRDAEERTDETRHPWDAELEKHRQLRSVFVVTGKTPEHDYYCASFDDRRKFSIRLLQDRWLENITRPSQIGARATVVAMVAQKKEEELLAKNLSDTNRLQVELEKRLEADKHEKAAQENLKATMEAGSNSIAQPKKRKRTIDRIADLEKRLERLEYELGLD